MDKKSLVKGLETNLGGKQFATVSDIARIMGMNRQNTAKMLHGVDCVTPNDKRKLYFVPDVAEAILDRRR